MRTILLIIIGMMFWACGSRKSEVNKSETEKKTESLKVEQKDVVKTSEIETHLLTNTDELIISPIDNEKEVVIIQPGKDTIKLRNAKIERRKAKTQVKQQQDIKEVDNSNTKVKEKVQEKVKTKEKATARKANNTWLWFLIPIMLILFLLARWIYKKLYT